MLPSVRHVSIEDELQAWDVAVVCRGWQFQCACRAVAWPYVLSGVIISGRVLSTVSPQLLPQLLRAYNCGRLLVRTVTFVRRPYPAARYIEGWDGIYVGYICGMRGPLPRAGMWVGGTQSAMVSIVPGASTNWTGAPCRRRG